MEINDLIRDIVETEVRKVLDSIVLPAAREEAVKAVSVMFRRAADTGPVRQKLARAADGDGDLPELGEKKPARARARKLEHLTVAQAAKKIGVTPKLVYFAIREGKLKSTKIRAPPGMKRGPRDGKLTVVTMEAVRAWRQATN